MQTVMQILMRRILKSLGIALILAGCTTQEPSKESGFGHWIQIAPERVGDILFARTPTEGALLNFVQKYVAETSSPIGNVKLVYLSANSIAELSRPLVLQKGQQEISVDYYSRATTSQSEVALLLFDQLTPTGAPIKGASKVVLLRLDKQTGAWKAP